MERKRRKVFGHFVLEQDIYEFVKVHDNENFDDDDLVSMVFNEFGTGFEASTIRSIRDGNEDYRFAPGGTEYDPNNGWKGKVNYSGINSNCEFDLPEESMSGNEEMLEDESFTTWNNGNPYAANQYNNDKSNWAGAPKQNNNSLIGRIIAAIILILIVLGILSRLGIGLVELGLIAGIIYLIVRKIKSPKTKKQPKTQSWSSSNTASSKATRQKPKGNQYGKASSKNDGPLVFRPTKGGVALLIIMCLWAMSGYANGGSPIICLIMVVIGLSGVFKKR